MRTKKKRRFLAGILALAISCSTVFSGAGSAFAAETIEETVEESVDTGEITENETPDEAEAVKRATAEDITIMEGDRFQIEEDLTGIHAEEEDEVTFKEAKDDEGKDFNTNVPGTYHCVYQVAPAKGEHYEITRKIIVKAREVQTKAQTGEGSHSGEEEEAGEEDGESDPAEVDTLENSVFMSVVPASMASTRASASLVQGEKIWYPSDLGNYSTSYFYVNDKLAYCLEANLSSPPSSDYVAEIYESNLNLQKVLYYGYGGPGDLTGSYLNGYSNDMKYVLTHIAASTAYAGESVGFYGCYESGIQKYGVREFIQYLYSQEAPPSAALSLSSNNQTAFLEGNVQKTKEITLKGDHRNYVNLSLPKEVTYHSTDGKEQTGGSVSIYGGTTFWFTAPKMSVSGTWKSGTLRGQLGGQWKTLVVSTGSGNQDIGYGEFYQEDSDSVSFQIQWLDIAKVKVIKEDKETGVNLEGAVFGLYSDKACTKLITKMPATDRKGASEVELVKTQDVIYLKEISVPSGYKLNTSSFQVELKVNNTTTVTVTNEEQKGKILIRKQGEQLSGVSGADGNWTFSYENTAFSGAKYKIYAAEDIYSQDKQTKIYGAGDLVDTLETGADGSCTTKLLHLGKYKVVEEQAPNDLTIGKTEEERTHDVTLSYAGQTVELVQEETTYHNQRPEVQVQVVKKSENDGVTLKGAVFGLYAAEDIALKDGTVLLKKDTLIQKVESDKEGNAQFTADIPIGFHYTVKEIQAPEFYYKSSDSYTFFYEYKDDETYVYTFAHTFENKEVRGEIHIKKIDKDTQDSVPQGDGNLDGAVYGLYAAEDIQHPNGKSGLLYKKDQLVTQGTIKNGQLELKDLYLGKYYVQEISAPPSNAYLVDETKYPVELSYEGQEVEIVHRGITVIETVKKQAFQLIKISEDGEQTETDLLAGAGFKVYLISSLAGVKDGTLKPSNGEKFVPEDFIGYDFSKEETASYYENGEKVITEEMFSDETGYVLSPELPYGEYVVIESTIPENMNGINPFLVTIHEDSREPQPWRIFDDRPFQFFFKIIKKDAQTDMPVLNNSAKYKIYDVENEEYVTMKVRYPEIATIDTFETNEEGYLQTPEQLKSGTYRIEEVESPDLYVKPGYENALEHDGEQIPLNEVSNDGEYKEAGRNDITITVDSNTAHEVEDGTGKYIVVVEVENDEAVGSLTLHKTGKVLVGAEAIKEQLLTKMKNGVASFVNNISEFFTGEDVMEVSEGYDFIYEEQGLKGVEFSVYARETIYSPDGQTDEEGNRIVRFEKDALVGTITTDNEGKGTLNNLPVGKYYLKETKTGESFVLDSEEKDFEITYQGQEVAVDYVTKEIQNKRQKIEIEIIKKSSVSGEVLAGVAFGLYAGEDISDRNGEVIVEKDALIEVAKTDENGQLHFKANLPHAKYYVKEVKHLPGYLPNEEKIEIDASYNEPEKETISISKEVENQPTVTEITKTDITGEKEVEGAKLQILDDNGDVVEEWVSAAEPHTIYALAPGEYILHEESAPTEAGYVRAEDVAFTVMETGEVQKVSMKDDHTKVEITKTDITGETEIEGAKLQVLDKDGSIIEEWVSGKEPHLIERLPVGEYTLHEETAPDGYVVVSDVKFNVEETGEIQKVAMKNEPAMGQVLVKKTDSADGTPLAGVEFEIRNKVTKEVVGKLVTDENGEARSEQLPIAVYEDGKMTEPIVYVLVETKPLDGYEEYTKEEEFVFTYQDQNTPVIEITKEIQNTKIPGAKIMTAPKTGDMTNIWLPLALGGISLGGIITAVIWIRRKHKRG